MSRLIISVIGFHGSKLRSDCHDCMMIPAQPGPAGTKASFSEVEVSREFIEGLTT
jgi:hypothetical protein